MLLPFPIPSFDTLLTLPSLLYFLLPSTLSTTSLQTYLNVLFFTLTWSTLVLSHNPLLIEFWATLGVHIFFYFVPSLLFLLFDTLVPSLSVSIKAHRDRALPQHAFATSNAPLRSRKLSASTQSAANLVSVSVLNILASTALQTAIDYALTQHTPLRSSLRITVLPPTPWNILADLTKAYVARGVLAYYIHRYVLHAGPRSSPTARIVAGFHRRHAHALRTCVPFGATYDHPLPFLLGTFVPTYAAAFAFRFHVLTYLLFVALTDLEAAFAHSGYTLLPSTVLLAGVARRREAHQESGGAGNFGPWGVMDWAHDTGLGGRDVLDDLREEATRRDLRGSARGLMEDANEGARGGGGLMREAIEEGDLKETAGRRLRRAARNGNR